jgi:serine/threonine protein kinase
MLVINCRPKKSLENLIPNSTDESIDLLRRLIQFNPDKRITAEDGLCHSYVSSYVIFSSMKFLVFIHFNSIDFKILKKKLPKVMMLFLN